jgi:hypothetical protein
MQTDRLQVKGINNVVYADQFASVQAAHDQLPSTGGKIVIPAGTYSGAGGATLLTISKPNVVVEGVGPSTILTTPASVSTTYVVRITGSNCRLTNLQIQGQATDETTNQYAVQIVGNHNEVDHLLLSGTDGSHALNGGVAVNSGSTNNDIHDNDWGVLFGKNNSIGYGVILVAASYNRVHHNNGTFSSTWGRHHIYLSQGSCYNTVSSNVLSGGTNASIEIFALDAQSTALANVVQGNTIVSNNSAAGSATDTGAIEIANNAQFNIVIGNNIDTVLGANGIKIGNAGGVTGHPVNNSIVGNKIHLTDFNAISVTGGSSNLIEGNDVVGASTTSSNVYSGLLVQPEGGVNANNNRVLGNNFSGATNKYAVSILAGSTSNFISDNWLSIGATGVVNDAGTTTLYGINAENGTSQIDGSVKAKNIEDIRYADQFASIDAAVTDLGGGAGIVVIPSNYAGAESASLVTSNLGYKYWNGNPQVTIIDQRYNPATPGTPAATPNYPVSYAGRTLAQLTRFGVTGGYVSPNDSSAGLAVANFVSGTMPANGGTQAGLEVIAATDGTNLVNGSGSALLAIEAYATVGGTGTSATMPGVYGLHGTVNIDRDTTTQSITTASAIHAGTNTNISTHGATITNSYGVDALPQSVGTARNYSYHSWGNFLFENNTNIDAVDGGGVLRRVMTFANGIVSFAGAASVNLTAQTAAIGTTTLYAVPASGAGQYRLSWNSKVTTAAGVSSTLGPLTITYTDPDNVVQTITAGAQTSAGAIATSSTGNSTTTVLLGCRCC